MTEILTLPKAVITEKSAPNVSAKYQHISTVQTVETLKEAGFYVRRAVVQNCRTRDPETARHTVVMRHNQFKETLGMVPEIIITNSHDRSTSFKMQAGLFRLVCSNGLVVAGEQFALEKAQHRHLDEMKVIDMAQVVIKQALEASKYTERYMNTILTDFQRVKYAKRVVDTIWPATHVPPELLLQVRRNEDIGNDLFKTFNVVQENIMKGGIQYNGNLKADGQPRLTRTRGITTINNDIKFNSRLWDLTETFYKEVR